MLHSGDVTDSALRFADLELRRPHFQIWKAVAIGGSSFSSIDGGELQIPPHFETKSTMSVFFGIFGPFSLFFILAIFGQFLPFWGYGGFWELC